MTHVIQAPALNTNDVEAVLIEWLVAPWQKVEPSDPICELESTKVNEELTASVAGYLYPAVERGAVVKVGDVLAWVFPSDDPAQLDTLEKESDGERVISKKARDLMRQHSLLPADMPGIGPIDSAAVQSVVMARQSIEDERIDTLVCTENSILIYGTGSHALVAHDTLLCAGAHRPVAFVDFAPRTPTLADLPVVNESQLPRIRERGVECAYICLPSVAREMDARSRLEQLGFTLVTVVHPTASIAHSAHIGSNVYLGPQTVVGPNAHIGSFSRILNSASIAHHCSLSSGVHVADGARLAGNVAVGENTLIGLGVTINKQLSIGKHVTIVSGVSVYENVVDNSVVRSDGTTHRRSR